METVLHTFQQAFRLLFFFFLNCEFCSLEVLPELTKLMLRDRKSCTLYKYHCCVNGRWKMMLPGLNFTSVNVKDSVDEICPFSAHMLLTVQK